MTSLQLWIWGEAFWAPKQIQGGVGVEGAKPLEALEILQLTLAKKCQKYTLVVHLHWITILSIVLIKVINTSTDCHKYNLLPKRHFRQRKFGLSDGRLA